MTPTRRSFLTALACLPMWGVSLRLPRIGGEKSRGRFASICIRDPEGRIVTGPVFLPYYPDGDGMIFPAGFSCDSISIVEICE